MGMVADTCAQDAESLPQEDHRDSEASVSHTVSSSSARTT